jgi:hypothetical protein
MSTVSHFDSFAFTENNDTTEGRRSDVVARYNDVNSLFFG